MRRFRQQIPDAEVRRILKEATNGVLSLVDSCGLPYGVPMSFVYDGEDTIYFHGARSGRKIDCIRHCENASFCVVALDDVQTEEFTTYYRSVIVSGQIYVAEGRDETVEALRMLGEKYSPGRDSMPEIEKSLGHAAVLKLEIESAVGKEAIELTRKR